MGNNGIMQNNDQWGKGYTSDAEAVCGYATACDSACDIKEKNQNKTLQPTLQIYVQRVVKKKIVSN